MDPEEKSIADNRYTLSVLLNSATAILEGRRYPIFNGHHNSTTIILARSGLMAYVPQAALIGGPGPVLRLK